MDMDDDLIGSIEFNLSPEQGDIVRRAIGIAARAPRDDFRSINPLIAIVQWWEANVPEDEKPRGSPEAALAEACRRFLLAHESEEPLPSRSGSAS
jgi:hypothetical protein